MRGSLIALMSAALVALAGCKPPPSSPASPDAPKSADAVAPTPAVEPAAVDPPESTPAEPEAPPDESAAVSFESQLEFIADVFAIRTHGAGAGPRLLVVSASRDGQPLGEPARQVIDGDIASAFASDLNADQSAEILVFTRSGGFAGFAFDAGRFTPMSLPELDAAQADAHAGNDEFRIEGAKLIRRFALTGGGTRTLVYGLGPAQAFAVESSIDS